MHICVGVAVHRGYHRRYSSKEASVCAGRRASLQAHRRPGYGGAIALRDGCF